MQLSPRHRNGMLWTMSPRPVCLQCHRPAANCYCHRIARIANDWPVLILQERREARHALGTARIAALSLSRCTLRQSDQAGPEPFAEQEPVLIYPGREARPIGELAGMRPRPLLFLDASWRKSRRMLHERPALARLPRYRLCDVPVSRYRIRRQPDARSLSTLEAITAALSLLEGEPDRYQPMLDVMDWMVDRQIDCMGETVYARNYPPEIS